MTGLVNRHGQEIDRHGEKVDKMLERIMAKRTEIVEKFCEAYLAETGLSPSEAELVSRVDDKGKLVTYFRRRATDSETEETQSLE